MMHFGRWLGLVMVGATVAAATSASAQQTIFNVPSADVTDRKKLYFEHESQFGPDYWYGTDYLAYGIGRNTELDLSLYNVSSPSSGNISLGTGFKSAFPFSGKAAAALSLQITAGAQGLTSLQNQGLGYWAYAMASGRIPGAGTRITAGVSRSTHQLSGVDITCFMGGIEHPLNSRLTLDSDWYSGRSTLGFWTTGFAYALSKNWTVELGYQIPNDTAAAGDRGFTIEFLTIG